MTPNFVGSGSTGKEDDDQAYKLMQDASTLSADGHLVEAGDQLEAAAAIHRRRGSRYDEARCLQMAASLHRMGGNTAKALALVVRASAVAPPDQQLSIAISTEQGEIALAENRFGDAVHAYSSAIDEARRARLGAEGLSSLLRRRALTSVAAGNLPAANGDFATAYDLLTAKSGRALAQFVRTEQADVLWRAGQFAEMERVVTALEDNLAGTEISPHLLAELMVAHARLARSKEQWDGAIGFAERARNAALEAFAPVSYFAACVELAEATQAQGRYSDAYSILVAAWATLSDVLSDEAASSWVEPVLSAYLIRWGEPAFRDAKAEYERRRRSELDWDSQPS